MPEMVNLSNARNTNFDCFKNLTIASQNHHTKLIVN